MVSEVMLQQTQVLRVIPKYAEFIEAFPTVSALSRASTADVLRIWKGMGYNRRALYLKRAAETIVREYGGKFPRNEEELAKLPGVGTYTARALLVFAYRKNICAVDTNIRKIIVYHFFSGAPQPEREIENVARQLVPPGKAWEWHQALMDYGALELPKKKAGMPGKGKKSVPFRQSDRYFRGRIMDILRDGDIETSALRDKLVRDYGRSGEYFDNLLKTLLSENMIAKKGKIFSLPD